MANDFRQSSRQYLSNIDAEIERLQQLRMQVAGAIEGTEAIRKPARRRISAEGRKRIAEAQKARWATHKQALKKTAAKTAKKGAKKKTKQASEPSA